MDYSRYQTLAITRRGAVLDIQMRAKNGKLPTAGHAGQVGHQVLPGPKVRVRAAGLPPEGDVRRALHDVGVEGPGGAVEQPALPVGDDGLGAVEVGVRGAAEDAQPQVRPLRVEPSREICCRPGPRSVDARR